eukprot:4915918-Pyramimonas_sp.AAC.1
MDQSAEHDRRVTSYTSYAPGHVLPIASYDRAVGKIDPEKLLTVTTEDRLQRNHLWEWEVLLKVYSWLGDQSHERRAHIPGWVTNHTRGERVFLVRETCCVRRCSRTGS